MRTKMTMVLGAAIAFGLLAAPAGAKSDTTTVETKVVIEGFTYKGSTDTVTFKGHVKCAEKCLEGRKVKLKRTDAGIPAGSD